MAETGFHIVVSEFVPPGTLEHLTPLGTVVYEPGLAQDREALEEAVARAHGLVVRNRTLVDAALLARAPHLRVVGRLGAGLDNMDVPACRHRGVQVVYSPWGNAASVAEHTVALALALAKRLRAADAMARSSRWDRGALLGTELRGKTWGIVGFGTVGRLVAEAARCLGMHCITHHPRKHAGHPDLITAGVDWVAEEQLWATAHIISIHLPLRPDTLHYVNARRLAPVRTGALLVNTSRGGVVDEAALLAALTSGRLAGAALDVREHEPPPQPDPLAALDQVILTPHTAGLTEEAQERVGRQVAEDVGRVLRGLPPLHPAPR
ncbi:MAG TPA: hydroxyacid dehydrogenase [Sphingobacteriaceae bacterium]|nr:hydroxyacid dehydrogenase [Sphingobacteriaceae bacterium]